MARGLVGYVHVHIALLLKNQTLDVVVTETFKVTLNNPKDILCATKFVCTQKLCLKKGCWPL